MATGHGIALQKCIVQSARIIAPGTLGIAKRNCCNGRNSTPTLSLRCYSTPTSCHYTTSSSTTSGCSRSNGGSARDGGDIDCSTVELAHCRPLENVLVVGGGIAGLAAAACLGRIGVRVTIATGRGGPGQHRLAPCGGGSREGGAWGDMGVGIWTHGLECLDKLGVLQRRGSEERYMEEAGYRDTQGTWLVRPSRPLRRYGETIDFSPSSSCSDETETDTGGPTILPAEEEASRRRAKSGGGGAKHASVLFVRESMLIEALRDALADNTEIIAADVDDIRRDEVCDYGISARLSAPLSSFSSSSSSSNNTNLSSQHEDCSNSSGWPRSWTNSFDLLMGADGPRSLIRSKLLQGDAASPDEEKNDAAHDEMEEVTSPTQPSPSDPARRGYVVYRGVCTSSTVADAAAMSRGVAAGGVRGGETEGDLESFQTWGPGLRFASVPLAGDGERMLFATVADGVIADHGEGIGRTGKAPPPSKIKPFLLETFGAWHAPVADLLRGTRDEDIVWEDARAMTRGPEACCWRGADWRPWQEGGARSSIRCWPRVPVSHWKTRFGWRTA